MEFEELYKKFKSDSERILRSNIDDKVSVICKNLSNDLSEITEHSLDENFENFVHTYNECGENSSLETYKHVFMLFDCEFSDKVCEFGGTNIKQKLSKFFDCCALYVYLQDITDKCVS